MVRRALAAFFAVLLTLSVAPLSAYAQSDTGEIDIDVQDAAAKTPVILARVLLDGPVITSEFTGNNGKVRFTDVPNGIYHARVFARGYQAVTSEQFEIVGGRIASVTVLLAPSANLKIIGSVVAKSSASVSTNTINSDSAQRKLSNDLADALNKLSGVSVSTSSNDSDATQTISLEGHDASQTQLTLDGVPLNAPGTAGDLRSIGTDLFTGASVSMGPQLGGLGGGVNFRTIDPTLSWQSAFSVSAGSYGKNNYSVAETGSLGKLGIALMHTYRSNASIADGMYYTDASGFAYSHAGDSTQIGSNVKLRYQMTPSQTVTGSYLSSTNNTDVICLQFTGPVPCGYGPGNTRNGKFQLYSLMDSALVGDTAVQASLYGTQSTQINDLTNRFVNGVAQPTGTSSTLTTRGLMVNATFPAKERHTISLSAFSTSTTSEFTPLVAQAAPYTIPGQGSSYSAVSINDSIQSSAKLRLTESFGVNKPSNASSSILASTGATWKPTNNDTFSASYSVGGQAPHVGRAGFLTDPAQLRFDCVGNVAYGSAPGDEPSASNSTSARLGYSRQLHGGALSASLYRQVQDGVVLPSQVNGSVLAGSGIFPPDYFGIAQNIFNSAAGCSAPLSTPFGPENVYFSTPIGGVRRVYEGGSISGYVTFGNLVLQPYYNIQSATIQSNDPRLNNAFSIEIPGNQVPNVPLHRAGLTMDYKAPGSSLEWLASANYTGANNPQNLPAFTTVDAGVSTQLTHGTLTIAASNIFNAYSGIFASSENAVPYTTMGGLTIPTIARPNAPRQISATYTVRFGQNVQQRPSNGGLPTVGGGGPGVRGFDNQFAGPGGADARQGAGNRGGFRSMLSPLPDTPPTNPFQLAQT
ncbi:MAG: TonB-dependent receptor, partial [Candidatus Eremiobacteraeota bacterium]|nr:TonB-dependent receptor [Candidatus Eremiobacteraeota bacterium]